MPTFARTQGSAPASAARSCDKPRAIALGIETLRIEAEAIDDLRQALGNPDSAAAACFGAALTLLIQCQGRIVVSGMGKSGHIARKIAATFASTGSPALFMHPAEAAHGDLGMLTPGDIFLAISNSGETGELMAILSAIRRMGSTIISMTGKPESSLAKLSAVHLDVAVRKEACPMNLAPTASTTAALAYGDALAVALLDARGFREEDFARSHPGGALGRRLLTRISDVMRTGNEVPFVRADVQLGEALLEITRKGMAMTAVVDDEQRVIGIFTDGDLRRLIEHKQNFSELRIVDVMHPHPRTVQPGQLAVDAVEIMERFRINQLLVTDAEQHLVGALHIHDLTRAKVI